MRRVLVRIMEKRLTLTNNAFPFSGRMRSPMKYDFCDHNYRSTDILVRIYSWHRAAS
jgi:hypothetical protein